MIPVQWCRLSPRLRPPLVHRLLVPIRVSVTGAHDVSTRAVFRPRRPDPPHLHSLVFQGVDPDLLSVMLGRQLADVWVPPLWKLYHRLRDANGPAFRADVFAAWARVREEWVPLWTKLREKLAAAIAETSDTGATGAAGSASSSAPRGSGRPPSPGAGSRRAKPAPRERSAGSVDAAAASAGSSSSGTGAVDLGVHGGVWLVSVDGAVHRVSDPSAESLLTLARGLRLSNAPARIFRRFGRQRLLPEAQPYSHIAVP